MKLLVFLLFPYYAFSANVCSNIEATKFATKETGQDIVFVTKVKSMNMATAKMLEVGHLIVSKDCSMYLRSKNKTKLISRQISPCSQENISIKALEDLKTNGAKPGERLVPDMGGIICNSLKKEPGCDSICLKWVDSFEGKDKYCSWVRDNKKQSSENCFQKCCD